MTINKKKFFEYEFKDDTILNQEKINLLFEKTRNEVNGALSHHLNQSLMVLCIVDLYKDNRIPPLEHIFQEIIKTIWSMHRKINKLKVNNIGILELSFLNSKNVDTENLVKFQIANKIIDDFLEDIQDDLVTFLDCKAVLRAFSIDCKDEDIIDNLKLCNKAIDKITEIIKKIKNIKEYKTVPYLRSYILDIEQGEIKHSYADISPPPTWRKENKIIIKIIDLFKNKIKYFFISKKENLI